MKKLHHPHTFFTKSIICLCLFLISFVASAVISAEELIVEYTFAQPTIEKIYIEGTGYDQIKIDGLSNGGTIGHPSLPSQGAKILLPPNVVVSDIKILPLEEILLGDDYYIEPVAQPSPISLANGVYNIPVPDQDIYTSSSAYPAEVNKNIGIQKYRGYGIEIIKLTPFKYIPLTGELYFYPKIKVILNTTPSDNKSSLFRGLAVDNKEIRDKVDNPEMADSYAALTKSTQSNYDMLIITLSVFANDFLPLKEFHDTTGVLTEIRTQDDIGTTQPDAVRDYIRNAYLNDGIQYVLIGSDFDFIQSKRLYVESWPGTGNYVETQMPTDMYYGCLDGTYNYDGDSRYGEPTDGENGGEVDLFAEVHIGRASVDSPEEIARFVNKTIQYLTTQDPYLQNVNMVGEHLGFGGTGEYGGYSLDEIIDTTSAQGYFTYGIPSNFYEINKLYDMTWDGFNWPTSELVNRINSSIHIINHYGHCNQDYAMKMTSTDVMNFLHNDNHFFLYSQGCMAGQFDLADCVTEYMTIKSDYAAFAAVTNARYGWGNSTTDGPSQRFDREFWDAVFNPAEAKIEISKANSDSKEDNIYRINESCMRWCTYELNVFGDPSIAIRKGSVGITADVTTGNPPLDVNFMGISGLSVQSWTWDFGDGGSAYTQSPIHTYLERGLYDVSLQINTGENTFSSTRSSYIAVIADTVIAPTAVGMPGEQVVLTLTATNTAPMSSMLIPVEYPGNVNMTLDSLSLVGCRTESCGTIETLHYDPFNKRAAFKINYASNELSPGQGEILKIYFTINGSAVNEQMATIELDGYNTYTPLFSGSITSYIAETISGNVMVYVPSCCIGIRGNINDDAEQTIDISDLVYFVEYSFGNPQGPEPPCFEEADVDASEAIDIGDLVYMVDFMFGSPAGPAPLICQ